uniref:hypothetical protein n=1 Tax=Alistipes sp. D31t1_170403_E11 TaxID=2787128 RepID=UPI00189C19B4|nr:hypothetical protein [Alistipes sp. D31t1_170403_E11]
MTREEYLQRPSIEGVVYKIDKNEIRVQNDCTLFIQIRNCRKVTLQEVQARFRQLKQEASASEKFKLKGTTKFMPAVRELYPAYRASCDDIERLFAELTEFVQRIKLDGIHYGCSDDELLEAATQRQNEISKYYWRNSAYSRFLTYDKCIRNAMLDRPWEDEETVNYTLTIA